MTRRYSPKESARKAKAKRDLALERLEFRSPSEPRTAPVGLTSFPVKAEDSLIRAMIDAELARRSIPSDGLENSSRSSGWNDGSESA